MLLRTAGRKTDIANRSNFDDAAVGVMALISMYQAVTFLLLQILMMIPVTIFLLISESQGWDKKTEEIVMTALMVLIELLLIVVLAKRGKKRFLQYMKFRQEKTADLPEDSWARNTSTITEAQIEISVVAAALIGIGWGLFIGIQVKSLYIMLIVVEGAALLFLSIFIIIRFLTTHKIRPTALVSLLLTGLSLWKLLHQ